MTKVSTHPCFASRGAGIDRGDKARPLRAAAWLLALILSMNGLLPAVAAPAPAAVASDANRFEPAAGPQPTAWSRQVQPLQSVALHEEAPLDLDAIAIEDAQRERDGLAPRFAIARPAMITPETAGTWEQVDQATMIWRLRVASPGALSLNLGFTRYLMPEAGQLFIYPADGERAAAARGGSSDGLQPVRFTAADNEAHGELWTPVLLCDDMIVEVTLPAKARQELRLELTSVNVGYRGFGEMIDLAGGDKSGTCNVDVVCPEGDGWRDEIASVGVISTGGGLFCTGFMVNNTAQDQRPYFMTANHCGISSGNAASLVVYWNFQSPVCGQQGGGSLGQFQTGSFFRASYATSDFTLVELDDTPDPVHEVSFSGWDRGDANPPSAVAIHHPNTDEKSISFEYDPLNTTSYLATATPGDGSHLRITDWDVGTTEPGSSGSPLYDQNHHVVGQLHGGYAACGNDLSDWYGRFSLSWTGGGSDATRLSNWLDPGSTGATSVDTYNPHASGLSVLPGMGLTSSGDSGGPFTPASIQYDLENEGSTGLDYSVTTDVLWLTIGNASGHLDGGASATVTVTINARAGSLRRGRHLGAVDFVATALSDRNTRRTVTLQVGVPGVAHSFSLDTNPGWTVQGQWAFGQPTGGGGAYGGPDPTSGHTGASVFGYNLAGDYPNSMAEYHLTTTAIDCSDLEGVVLKFWRWLGVEQPAYDHARLRASNDGINWTLIWENTDQVADSQWTQVTHDISAVADRQATVYLRWSMGPTDESWEFCGWNIDDIEIWGLLPPRGISNRVESPAGPTLFGNIPNPFNPLTEIRFELEAAGPARVAVYDLRGRLVRTLHDGPLPAGPQSVIWGGTDATGRAVSSGTYLCRLENAGVTRLSKLLLAR